MRYLQLTLFSISNFRRRLKEDGENEKVAVRPPELTFTL